MTSTSGPSHAVDRWSRYFDPSDVHRDLGLYCAGAGQKSGSVQPVEKRTLPCHAAVLVEEGAGWFESPRAGRRRDVEGPALLWLFPGLPHSYGPSGSRWTESWVLFGGTAARSYEQLGYLSRDDSVQDLTHLESVVDTFSRALQRCAVQSPHQAAEAAVMVHQLIAEAGQARAESEAATGPPSLVDRLREQACTSMTIDEHARRLAVPVPALRAAVRAADVDGPKELVMQTRMGRAQALLTESAMPVRAVAREVGYADPAYFTRLFTRRIGVSPSRFRQQHRAAAGQRLSGEAACTASAGPPAVRPRSPADR